MADKNWPAWHYGPNGASDIFASADEVPAGWKDHPSLVTAAEGAHVPANAGGQGTTSPPSVNPGDKRQEQRSKNPGDEMGGDIDADGWEWDPNLHASTKAKTTAGLWRMKVGAKRPDPKPGFPKVAKPLDL